MVEIPLHIKTIRSRIGVTSMLTMLNIFFLILFYNSISASNFTNDENKSRQLSNYDPANFPVVTVTEGKIRGMITRMNDGFSFNSFLGIPYAAKPERFKAPLPPSSWTGTRDALKEGPGCFQYFEPGKQFLGSEDCLYASVHSPSLTLTKLPVIVWVFGGAFKFGLGSPFLWGPDKLVRQGAVVVLFNYRLGVFGFLSSRTKDAPGNAGMKDIVALLRWIKSNVKSFGGDPENVTLYGVSSGGAAVDYMIVSPMAKGLFQKAIIGSGTSTNSWAFNDDPLVWTFKLGRKLNINTNNVNKLLESLKQVPPEALLVAGDKIDKEEVPHPFRLTFVPSVEVPIDGEEIFLPKTPLNILQSGNYNKVPQIISFTNDEGLSYFRQLENSNIYDIIETFLPQVITKKIKSAKIKWTIVNLIKNFYFQRWGSFNITQQGIIDFLSDSIILYELHNNLKLKLKSNNFPIYYSEFAYSKKARKLKVPRGVAHEEDVGFVLSFPYENPLQLDSVTSEVTKRQVTMMYNFALYGNPTPTITSLIPLRWKPVLSNLDREYLKITDVITMTINPNKIRYELWNQIYSLIQ